MAFKHSFLLASSNSLASWMTAWLAGYSFAWLVTIVRGLMLCCELPLRWLRFVRRVYILANWDIENEYCCCFSEQNFCCCKRKINCHRGHLTVGAGGYRSVPLLFGALVMTTSIFYLSIPT